MTDLQCSLCDGEDNTIAMCLPCRDNAYNKTRRDVIAKVREWAKDNKLASWYSESAEVWESHREQGWNMALAKLLSFLDTLTPDAQERGDDG